MAGAARLAGLARLPGLTARAGCASGAAFTASAGLTARAAVAAMAAVTAAAAVAAAAARTTGAAPASGATGAAPAAPTGLTRLTRLTGLTRLAVPPVSGRVAGHGVRTDAGVAFRTMSLPPLSAPKFFGSLTLPQAADGPVGLRDNAQMIELQVLQADVTKLELDAITNAANTRLRHGGGVAAAIVRAGGPEVQRESNEKAPIGLGEAVETTAGDMPARYVIHAATMELGGPTSAEIITRATRSTLRKADELGCRSLALVAFGTGVGGFPLEDAARLMVDAVRRHQPQHTGTGRVRGPRRRGRAGVSSGGRGLTAGQVALDGRDFLRHRVGGPGSPVHLDHRADPGRTSRHGRHGALHHRHHLFPGIAFDHGEHRIRLVG